MRCSRRLLSLALISLVLVGCAESPRTVELAGGPDEEFVPRQLDADSVDRKVEKYTYRIRNLTCDEMGVSLGSGFAIDRRTIVTNRHVAEGAATIEINTWTGGSVTADVEGIANFDDLALVRVGRTVPGVAPLGSDVPQIGDELATAGFPQGNAFQLSRGTYLGMGVGPYGSKRMTFDDPLVTHGNSGGPVTNESGKVIGVLTEGDEESSTRYAIPVAQVSKLAGQALESPRGC